MDRYINVGILATAIYIETRKLTSKLGGGSLLEESQLDNTKNTLLYDIFSWMNALYTLLINKTLTSANAYRISHVLELLGTLEGI